MVKQFRGTGVALVTPFKKDNSIDFDALEKLINHVIREGVNYLVALGTTAETSTLSLEEKKELLAFIIKTAGDRVPVICGVGGNNTGEVLQQLEDFDLSAVTAILSVAPYYNKPSQEGIYQHYKAIAEATTKDIILYNVPARTGINILPETVFRLAEEFKHIIGIKEASGNIPQCMELVQKKPNRFVVLSGDDNLVLAQIAVGLEGVISVAANCYPKDFTYIVNAAMVNKFDRARDVQYKILDGIHLLSTEGNPAGVKAVLHEMGICENILRKPLVPVSGATLAKIKDFVKTL